jgi:DNA polymerase-4
MIVHLDIDAFFASVEQRLVPALRGRPVAVGSGCIASCSYEARRYGLCAGMELAAARQRCPGLVVLKGSQAVYRCFSARIWELCREMAPAVDTYLDDAYLDMAGTERLYGDLGAAVEKLRKKVFAATGLTVTAGIGPNRMVARLAGKSAKPDGLRRVRTEEVEGFIAGRPASDLPGVGPRTAEVLADFNVHTVQDLRRLPLKVLIELFGRIGAAIYDRARGRDTRPVAPREVPTGISRETTFHQETTDPEEIRAVLHYLVERAVKAARAQELTASRCGVRIRYADFAGDEASVRMRCPTDLETDVFAAATDLLRRLQVRRVALRLVGVTLSGLVANGAEQLDLFETPDERGRALAAAVDDVRVRWGFAAITAGPSLDLLGRLRQERDGYVLRTPSLTK